MKVKEKFHTPNGIVIVTDEIINKNIYQKIIRIGDNDCYVKGVTTSDFYTIFIDGNIEVNIGDQIII